MMRVTRVLLVALLTLGIWGVSAGEQATAHGRCGLSATKPAFSSWTHQKIHGRADMLCRRGHHRLHLVIQLQRRNSAAGAPWVVLSRAEVNPVQTRHARAIASSGPCMGGQVALWLYRIKVTQAWAVRRDGARVHILAPPVRFSTLFATDSFCVKA